MKNYTNKVIHGDSLKILKEIPDISVDLVITSPPYFKQRNYGNGNCEIGSEPTEQQYLENILAIFEQCVRVTKNNGAIVFNLGDKYVNGGLSLIPYKFAIEVLEKKDVFLVNNIIWSKLNPTPRQDKRKLVPSTEPFFLFAKSKAYKFNLCNFLQHLDIIGKKQTNATKAIGQKYFELIENSDLTHTEKQNATKALKAAIDSVFSGEISSFRMKIRGIHKLAYGGQAGGRNNQIRSKGFSIIKIYGNKMKKDLIESPVENTKDIQHTAVYPLYIIQELVKLLTDENDLVLDPFNGSGTTCVAAKILNRKFIGIEINSEYVRAARQRIEKVHTLQELIV